MTGNRLLAFPGELEIVATAEALTDGFAAESEIESARRLLADFEKRHVRSRVSLTVEIP